MNLRGPYTRHCARKSQFRIFEKISQRWRAVDKTVPNFTNRRFEPQTSRSRDERVTAGPTGRSETRSTCLINCSIYFCTLHLNFDCCCYFLGEKTSNTIVHFITKRGSNRISESDRVFIFFTCWTIFSIWYIRWAIAVVKAGSNTIYCKTASDSRSIYWRNYLQIHKVCSNYIPG